MAGGKACDIFKVLLFHVGKNYFKPANTVVGVTGQLQLCHLNKKSWNYNINLKLNGFFFFFSSVKQLRSRREVKTCFLSEKIQHLGKLAFLECTEPFLSLQVQLVSIFTYFCFCNIFFSSLAITTSLNSLYILFLECSASCHLKYYSIFKIRLL